MKDEDTKQPLEDASVSLKDTHGTVTDADGYFYLLLNVSVNKDSLFVSYVGYDSKAIAIHDSTKVFYIFLKRSTTSLNEVTVATVPIPRHVLESPVTMLYIDANKIEQLPNENFYAGLATQKGVDVVTGSLFFKSLNLRGFSWGEVSEGVLPLVDGMDITPPGQGVSFGNLNGPNDVDVNNIEIIPGAATAIYGANAFSGLINTTTKNPFDYEGLTVQIKNGCNYIDNSVHPTALFSDYQLRYAKAFKKKFAFKINLGYQRGTDWLTLSQTDFNPSPDGATGLNNPGRDIANIFGDEVQKELPIGINGSLVNVSRTGWNANEISGTTTDDVKAGGALHYRFNSRTELSGSCNYSLFNTNIGSITSNLRNFSVTYGKLELKNGDNFIRVYHVQDHDGNSYFNDAVARLTNNKWKSDSLWFDDYMRAYNGLVNGVTANDHEAARAFADIGMPEAGSEEFNQLSEEFRLTPTSEGGARTVDESGITKLLAQYDFSKMILWAQIICGVDFGWRKLYTQGTIVYDYPPPHPIHDDNYSGYLQLKKDFFNKRLNLLASARLDKFTNFNLNITPRIAVVYEFHENNFLRASFQTGTQTPDPFFMYTYFIDPSGFTGVGGAKFVSDQFGLLQRSFDASSVENFTEQVNAYVGEHGQNSLDDAVNLYKDLLKPSGIDYLQPQKVKTFEAGYQSIPGTGRLHIDADVFASIYHSMIGAYAVKMAASGNPFNNDSLDAAAYSFATGKGSDYVTGVNEKQNIFFGGSELGVDYNFYKKFMLSGNFTFNYEDWSPDIYVGFSHLPRFKSNLSLSNPAVYKRLGFSLHWRWTDAVSVNHIVYAPNVNNYLPANSVIDAQVNYSFPKINTMLKLGASNLLNHYYLESANGASIGGMYYVSILYDAR